MAFYFPCSKPNNVVLNEITFTKHQLACVHNRENKSAVMQIFFNSGNFQPKKPLSINQTCIHEQQLCVLIIIASYHDMASFIHSVWPPSNR